MMLLWNLWTGSMLLDLVTNHMKQQPLHLYASRQYNQLRLCFASENTYNKGYEYKKATDSKLIQVKGISHDGCLNSVLHQSK